MTPQTLEGAAYAAGPKSRALFEEEQGYIAPGLSEASAQLAVEAAAGLFCATWTAGNTWPRGGDRGRVLGLRASRLGEGGVGAGGPDGGRILHLA
jgi:hypothetical protein